MQRDKRHKRKPSASLRGKLRATLRRGWLRSRVKQQRKLCAICGEPFRETVPALQATCDHIIPKSKGGRDHYENVQAAHRRCNSRKADKFEGEY